VSRGDDLDRQFGGLVAVAAHAFGGKERPDQDVGVELGPAVGAASAGDDAATLARQPDGRGSSSRSAGGAVHHQVGSPGRSTRSAHQVGHVTAGDVGHRLEQVFLIDIDGMSGAALPGASAPVRPQHDGKRDSGAASPGASDLKLQIFVLTRFLPANRFPLRSKTL